MSTFDDVEVTCGVCGHTFETTELMSTNAFGSPDLDLRPPEMRRSTMSFWITKCPKCGYVHEYIERKAPRHARFVKSREYKKCQGYFFTSPLAADFYRYALVRLKEKSRLSAYEAFLHAAWQCDDFYDAAGATACRKKAIRLYNRRLFGKNPNLKLRHVDLLRRAGMFREALEFLESFELEDAVMKNVARFQKELCVLRDRSCYRIEDSNTVFMKLLDEPFELMRSGRKKIEVRLNDEKRKRLKPGDGLIFTRESNPTEFIRARVVGVKAFGTFDELYHAFPTEAFGYTDKTPDELARAIYEIYSREDCERYGALAIKIKVEYL